MPTHSHTRVDAYIAHAAPFAQPILERLRADVHAACPGVEEAIKWSMPFFIYAGRNLAHMAAFKAHCAFGFELGRAVVDLGREAQAMGQFGRLTGLADLPSSAELRKLVKKAVALIDAGVPAPRAPKSGTLARPAAAPPSDFASALATAAAAKKTFTELAPSHRREYVEWINEAKREETRTRRITQAVAWLAEGKRRNWRHEAR